MEKNNLEMQEVTPIKNESVSDVLGKIGEVIKELISGADVECCHRIPTRDADKTNIVVQFRSRAKRDAVLKG